VTRIRVRARAGRVLDCDDNSVGAVLAAPCALSAEALDVAAEPSTAANIKTGAVRVIFAFRSSIHCTLAHRGAGVNARLHGCVGGIPGHG
jgi:hypothetical protein